MKTYIVDLSTDEKNHWQSLAKLPEFRKATKNMMMATSVIKPIVDKLKSVDSLAFVLGSSYGELETSKEFLKTLSQSGIARPFLFQNSLHNATAGFTTLHFGIRGPSITVSQCHFTGESVLSTAMTLIQSGHYPLVLAVAVDSLFTGMKEGFSEIYPEGTELSEGAAAMLLSSEVGLKILKGGHLGVLEKIETFNHGQINSNFSKGLKYYESNGMELLCNEIRSDNPQFNFKMPKPNGAFSVIRWSKS